MLHRKDSHAIVHCTTKYLLKQQFASDDVICLSSHAHNFTTAACRFCVSRKGGTGGGGWGAVHMAVVRLGCKSNMVGTRLANSRPGCMSRLRKCYSHPSGGSFLAGKAS